MVVAAVVFRLPALHRDRLVLPHGIRRQPALQRGKIHERFECGARLALGGNGAVVLAFGIVLSTYQGTNRAVGGHDHDCALRELELLALGREFLHKRFLRSILQTGIDRGLDHEVVLHASDQIVEHVHDPVRDVVDRARPIRLHRMGGLRQRGMRCALVDEAGLAHGHQHDLGTALRAVRVAARCKSRRGSHEAGEHRSFRDPHLPGRLAEIALGGRLHAVSARTEIDAVEIKLENLRLAEFVLEPERQDDLLQLAPEGALLGEKQIFGKLLGDGRAALRNVASQHIGNGGANKPDWIDPEMAVETAVLDRNEGLRQIGRELPDRYIRPAHLPAARKRASVSSEDLDCRGTLGDGQGLNWRQRCGGNDQCTDGGHAGPEAKHHSPIQEPGQDRAPQRATAALARGCGRMAGAGLRWRRALTGSARRRIAVSFAPGASFPHSASPAVRAPEASVMGPI